MSILLYIILGAGRAQYEIFEEVFLSLFYFMYSSVRAAHNLESLEGFSSVYFNLYSPWDEPCTIWDLWIIL